MPGQYDSGMDGPRAGSINAERLRIGTIEGRNVEKRLAGLDNAIDFFHQGINELEERLAPLLVPAKAQIQMGEKDTEAAPDESNVALRIHGAELRVASLRQRLQALLQQLDV